MIHFERGGKFLNTFLGLFVIIFIFSLFFIVPVDVCLLINLPRGPRIKKRIKSQTVSLFFILRDCLFIDKQV